MEDPRSSTGYTSIRGRMEDASTEAKISTGYYLLVILKSIQTIDHQGWHDFNYRYVLRSTRTLQLAKLTGSRDWKI